MICMHMMDQIDPYPLVLRRPQPKSQADIWFDQEFAELLAKKKVKEEKPKPKFRGNAEVGIEVKTWNAHPRSPLKNGVYLTKMRDSEHAPQRREYRDGKWMYRNQYISPGRSLTEVTVLNLLWQDL